MFVALRDLRFAKGRFVLIGSVVALITVLVGFLSGLTGGLAVQNVSAILALPADRLAFTVPAGDDAAAFATSAPTRDQADAIAATPGVTRVDPLGISQLRAETTETGAAVAVFGVPAGFTPTSPSEAGSVTLSASAADELGAAIGDELTIGGTSLRVESIGPDAWYSHTPVVEVSIDDWRELAASTGTPDAFATVLAVTGEPDWAAVDADTGVVTETLAGSLTALAAFRSEIGSLLLMVVMLFGISGLVIGAFFTVWTMQRQNDVAVLKALGASTASLARDALGQALLLLLAGIGTGVAIVVLLGTFAGQALPFLLSPLTTLVPGAIMVALGLAGAAFALRSVTTADPLTALGGNR